MPLTHIQVTADLIIYHTFQSIFPTQPSSIPFTHSKSTSNIKQIIIDLLFIAHSDKEKIFSTFRNVIVASTRGHNFSFFPHAHTDNNYWIINRHEIHSVAFEPQNGKQSGAKSSTRPRLAGDSAAAGRAGGLSEQSEYYHELWEHASGDD